MLLTEIDTYLTELPQLHDSSDKKLLYDMVHKIHSATKYLGVPELGDAAYQFEIKLKHLPNQAHPSSLEQILLALTHLQKAQLNYD